jgi:hypothetical protein
MKLKFRNFSPYSLGSDSFHAPCKCYWPFPIRWSVGLFSCKSLHNSKKGYSEYNFSLVRSHTHVTYFLRSSFTLHLMLNINDIAGFVKTGNVYPAEKISSIQETFNAIDLIYFICSCRTISKAVSCRFRTVTATVRSQVRSSRIYGGQSDTGADFLRVFKLPLQILIQPTAPHSSTILSSRVTQYR